MASLRRASPTGHLGVVPRGPPAGGPAIRLTDVRFSYPGPVEVLRGIDLKVAAGSSLVLMGPSGCGKTTLLKVIAGLLAPTAGVVEVLGVQLLPGTVAGVRHRIGYVPQQLGLVRSLTAHQNVLIGGLHRVPAVRSLFGIIPESELEEADRCLESVAMGPKADMPVRRLSGGERQRVAIARALMQRPDILLADELISGLDFVRAREIMELVSRIRERGVTTVISLHDLTFASAAGDRVVVLKEGLKVLDGNPVSVTPETVRGLFG